MEKGSLENLHRFLYQVAIFCERCLGKCRDVKGVPVEGGGEGKGRGTFATMSVEPPVAITVGRIALIGVYWPGHTY